MVWYVFYAFLSFIFSLDTHRIIVGEQILSKCEILSQQLTTMTLELIRMLWIVDYIQDESSECLVVEADSYDDAYDKAVEELKILGIPRRYILKLEEF